MQILQDGLLSLEENNDDLSVVDEIFRSAHTIKGSAAMLGFTIVSKLAHKMEDLLGKIRSRERELSESVIDLLLQTVDTLTMQVESIPSGETGDETILQMFTDLYAVFLEEPPERAGEGGAQGEAPAPAVLEAGAEKAEEDQEQEREALARSEEELLASLAEFPKLDIPEDEEASGPEEEEVPPEGPTLPAIEALEDTQALPPKETPSPTPKAAPQKAPPHKPVRKAGVPSMVSASEKKVVRVEVEGLNLLMNLVGELIINRTRLDQRIVYVNKLSTELNFSQERLLKAIRDFKEKYEFGQLNDTDRLNGVRGTEIQDLASDASRSEENLLEGFFELEFDKYDDFNILSRRLVEIGADISEIMTQLTEFFDQFEDESSQVRRITNDLQEEITNIRMVPVGQLFNRFHLTVRDVAKQESKTVSLKISGEDAKLDKAVINEITDPLMHLVRNSVSHGIESPETRESRGKPREGTVSLNAYKEGDTIIIEINDDGNGIDVTRIRESIAEKGLLHSMAEIENMPDEQVMHYIFEPGFSTRKDVDPSSGRGVGMDVVKTNIAKLGGSIDITTEPGKGTKFSIKLPLTLLINPALLLKCGGQEFAISLTSVEETARIPVNHIHNVGSQEVIKLREQVLPIRRLRKILGYSPTNGTAQQPSMPIVIVRSGERTLALMVDELLGRETIVIKPLGDYLRKVALFSGATISGEGKVRLILDIATIVDQELVTSTPGEGQVTKLDVKAAAAEALESRQVPKKPAELILIDDSISIRKVVGMFLSHAGYHVDVAVDGVDAMEKIRTKAYDLILTDLEMPRMHGYEVITAVRSKGNMVKTPIIVLTSRAGEKHYSKAMELGADDYIVKPVDEETLLQSVRKLLVK